MRQLVFAVLASCAMAGCQPAPETPAAQDTDVVWAVNVGGAAYTALDGNRFAAEEGVRGGTTGEMDTMKGVQDPALYATYRTGDVRVTRDIDNGTQDLTFLFAEPEDYAHGERLFDIYAGERRIVRQLDVMRSRDGRVRSGLSVTVPDVEVTDGELALRFEASSGQPILSGLVVRRPHRRADDWQLAWSDEFDYAGPPDAAKWSIDEWPARVVNDEDQAYTARPRNLRVGNGLLTLEAHKETYEDADYTSARIHSKGKGDFLYGRFEVRAKLPSGQGTWPAIWMLPSDPFRYASNCEEGDTWQGSSTCDAWPNSGEIDIMEHVGYEMGHVHGTVHTRAYYWVNWEQRKGRVLQADVADTFHIYALEWTPERIDIFIDDTRYFTYMNEHEGWEEWPFDHPFHLILNVAVGGHWGRAGGPIDNSIFPQRMQIDYVRVFTR